MNIAIDGRPVEKASSGRRGIGLYTRHLCTELLKRNQYLPRPHSFTIVTSKPGDIWEAGARVRSVLTIRKPSRLQWILDQWVVPRLLRSERIDVFHATELTPIRVCRGTKVIAHVQDMIPFLFWKEYSRRIPIDYRCALKLARRQLAEAACVVTISEHSKKDIAELTGYPEERIYVAYLGPPDEREGPNENFGQGISGTKPVRHEPRPYFLYVGGTDYRKNVHFLIRAFARFAQEEQDSQLLLVGETFALRSSLEIAELVREIDRLQIANRVLMMGYVDDRKLQELYRHSVALVFPSLYEGFGLPVLEAMTYGTTVVAARTSSIPEVLGDTGLYFDPRDEESLVAALHTVYDGGDRCKDLIEKAKKRAQLFSWNTLGNVVFEIHQKLERA